jgi:hypothetical protein
VSTSKVLVPTSPYVASRSKVGLTHASASHVDNGLSSQNQLRAAQIASIMKSVQLSSMQPAALTSLVLEPCALDRLVLVSQEQPSSLAVVPSSSSQERLFALDRRSCCF